MHELRELPRASKPEFYAELAAELRALLHGESDFIASAANTAALLYWSLPELNWAGFYLLDRGSGDLIVGPFQGKPACVRIPLGKGVCGTAARDVKTIVVPDVHAFPGHIPCDAASNSEIVVPMVSGGELIGVLDLDSPSRGRFDEQDACGLEEIVSVFLECSVSARSSP